MSTVTNNVPTNDQWERVKKELRSKLGDDVFSNWFERVNHEGTSDGIVRLSVPTRFLKKWIDDQYGKQLIGLWKREQEDITSVELTVRGELRPQQVLPSVDTKTVAAGNNQKSIVQAPSANGQSTSDRQKPEWIGLKSSKLESRQTFETFVEGDSNNLALAAARQFANGQGVGLSPLYMHSSVGLGKTHLLNAIAQKALANGRKVLYLTVEQFLYDFASAMKAESLPRFKEELKAVDFLLIEDIQFLHSKKVNAEVYHILNALLDSARSVAVSSDRSPFDLDNLDDRVRSRLSSGLVVSLQGSDFALRRGILGSLAQRARDHTPLLEITDTVLDYVARRVTSSNRDLMTSINRLIGHSNMTNQPITEETSELVLKDLIHSSESRSVKIEDIQRVVCKHYDVTKADLLSARRTRIIVRPRQVAMYLAKVMTSRSLPEIGRRFGNRDHTTVLHAVKKMEAMIKTDYGLSQEVVLLKRKLQP